MLRGPLVRRCLVLVLPLCLPWGPQVLARSAAAPGVKVAALVRSPAPQARDLGLTVAANESQQPGVVEVTLDVREERIDLGTGKEILALTYNGGVPGPVIVAKLGDELVLHVKNSSNFPTILHPHGFTLPHPYDGTHLSQHPVMKGGVFTHRFRLLHAGTYWYHSHHDASEQMGRGLYGAIIVQDPREPPLREKVLVLSQVNTAGGPPDVQNLLEERRLLVNGRTWREASLRPGESQRLRIINATTEGVVSLRLSNGAPLVQIATDGGLAERPYPLERLRLDAGERADVIITAPRDSRSPIELIAEPVALIPLPESLPAGISAVARAATQALLPQIQNPQRPTPIVRFSVEGEVAPALVLPERLATIPDTFDFAATRDFTVGVQLAAQPAEAGPGLKVLFPINNALYPDVPVPTEQLGTWVKHRWRNQSPSPHPIHVHGFRFIVLSRNGVSEPVRGWKDTVDLAPFGELEYALYLKGYPGEWLYHCHFEGHMEGGTMGSMIVVDPERQGNAKPAARRPKAM